MQVWAGGRLQKMMNDFYGIPYPDFRGGIRLASADINHDGRVDGTDLSMVLGAWGTTDAAADIDHDGHVGGSDLSLVLGSWG